MDVPLLFSFCRLAAAPHRAAVAEEVRKTVDHNTKSNHNPMVQKRKKSQQKRPSNHSLSHELGSESVSERSRKLVSAAERASEVRSVEQADE